MNPNKRLTLISFLFIVLIIGCSSQQKADRKFDVSVATPAFTTNHPRVLFDEVHNNMHTARGTYLPFVELIKNDGCVVEVNTNPFSIQSLNSFDILVISNAKGGKHDDKEKPAFKTEECSAVKEWIAKGGALLLIADHYPMGSAAENLAQQFGVHMFNGETGDSIHFEGDPSFRDRLVFSRANGLIGNHPITVGINKILSDRGQSLTIPEGASPLLKLSETSYHMLPDSIWKEGRLTKARFQGPFSAVGNCQALAINFEKGRVVILGEAAMVTAQVYKGERFGMNVPGNDNKQFALNIIRWLGKAL